MDEDEQAAYYDEQAELDELYKEEEYRGTRD